MSRSAADATRFTATGPYASSRIQESPLSAASLSTSGAGWPGPPNETPKQKVERLRAQARAARMAKETTPLDRLIGTGRVWADRLHRVTVFTLLAASGVAGVLTIYSAGSLVLYNRRQRELWIARQLDSLAAARRAYLAGTASLEQLELLAKEKEADAQKMAREELKKQRYTYKARQWLFGDLAKTEGQQAEPEVKPYADAENGPSLLEALRAKRIEALEGPFDFPTPADAQQYAQDGSTAQSQGSPQEKAKSSWLSWMVRR
ncbi:hypothetical protein KEM52_005322 [Ascosphaera acerosa]|nr:hypothetical protein KEM52_005322 [Ascosphaera acerosa]